jgi:hypothetical protein
MGRVRGGEEGRGESRRGRWKKRVLLLAVLLLGSAVRWEQSTMGLRLREVRLDPPGVLADTVAWNVLDSAGKRYWPWAWIRGSVAAARLEARHPVDAHCRCAGWGNLILEVRPIEAWLRIRTASGDCMMARDGRAWLAGEGIVKAQQTPVLGWSIDPGKALTPPVSGDAVFRLDESWVRAAEDWEAVFAAVSADARVKIVRPHRVGGSLVVRAEGTAAGKALKIDLPESADAWGTLLAAAGRIAVLEAASGDVTSLDLDATYGDKLVRARAPKPPAPSQTKKAPGKPDA